MTNGENLNLSFSAADLTSDAGWDDAVADCDFALHVASPLPHGAVKNENDVIVPARDGALWVMGAAHKANVKRTVLTSAFHASTSSRQASGPGSPEGGRVAAMSLPAPTRLPSRPRRPTHRESGMGLIHIEMFATLDLVGQAPGSPDEDPVGFPFGGWQAPLLDEVTGAQVVAAYEGTDALLLGQRTYDIFAAYWPYQEGGEDNEIATLFNSVPKYVASRGRPDLSWAGSTQLGPDLAGAVREIRDRHEHVKVVGSLNLVQTLLREKLFDRLDLWVHPVVLGVGKKVFDGGAMPMNVTLLEPPVASPKGIVSLRYGLADGTPGTGDMSAPDRGAGRDD